MKRQTIVWIAVGFFIIFISTISLQAQCPGVKGGLNIAKFSGNTSDNVDILMGFVFGGFVYWDISKHLRIQPELLFNIKGSKRETSVMDNLDKYSTKLTYLEIPLLFQYITRRKSPFNFGLILGPTLGWNIKARMKLESGGDIQEEDLKNIKNFDFSIIFGVTGILFERITVDIRYNYGLLSIRNHEDMANEKNRVFSIMLGYCLF